MTACYDDTKLWEELNDHEQRLQNLELLCSQMNTNIASLQTIVTALQTNDHITAVVPINEGDKVIGYTITFSKMGGQSPFITGKTALTERMELMA